MLFVLIHLYSLKLVAFIRIKNSNDLLRKLLNLCKSVLFLMCLNEFYE